MVAFRKTDVSTFFGHIIKRQAVKPLTKATCPWYEILVDRMDLLTFSTKMGYKVVDQFIPITFTL